MTTEPSWLTGKRVLALAHGHDLTTAVIAGAERLGAHVARLRLHSQSTIASDIDAAIADAGAPDLVVINVIPEAAMQPAPLTDLTEGVWRDTAMEGLRTTVRVLQALGPHVKGSEAAVVFVAPSLSLVGAPSLTPLTTLLEGQRGLMKSVARQWGGSGVTVNWIAAAPRALAPFAGVALAAKPDAVTVALGRAPDPDTEIAPLLGYLGSLAGRAMTGATLMLDGGEWMTP